MWRNAPESAGTSCIEGRIFANTNVVLRLILDCGITFQAQTLIFSPKIYSSFYKKTRAWCMPATSSKKENK